VERQVKFQRSLSCREKKKKNSVTDLDKTDWTKSSEMNVVCHEAYSDDIPLIDFTANNVLFLG